MLTSEGTKVLRTKIMGAMGRPTRGPKMGKRWAAVVPTRAELEAVLAGPDLVLLAASVLAGRTLEGLVAGTDPDYRPSIYWEGPESLVLAEAYDRAQAARGDSRRAFRGGRWPQEWKGATR